MRIAAVADLHGHLPDIEPCDVLLLAGDLRPPAAHEGDAERDWLDGPFRRWLDEVPARHTVSIAGNHDFLFERAPDQVPTDLAWTYLQDTACEVDGLTIWGSPWTPWFFDWAFNAPREDGETFLAQRYAAAPDTTDVLLLHGPPAGYGDRTSSGQDVGSTAALATIDRIQPRACVFGHIHEGRGAWTRGRTSLLNCAAVDEAYALLPAPVVTFDL